MALHKEDIREALKEVKYPGFSRDIVSFGLVNGIEYVEGIASVALAVTTADPQVPGKIKRAVEERLDAMDEVREAHVTVSVSKPKSSPAPGGNQPGTGMETLKRVKYKIAIASGKGGVGKSTFAVNLACALERALGRAGKPSRVGIMDCDIYGPSVPLMIGINDQPVIEDNLIQPIENFGVRVISMGMLIDEETPVVWRGPMIMKTIQQFASNVAWGELEVLVVDLPPGTGDAQLSLVQTIPLDGAVVVTTPQAAAVNVARRGAGMFGKVNVPLLGVAENMSYLLDAASGQKQPIFGEGGGESAARDLETAFLGQVPLDPQIRIGCDRGIPIVISHPQSESAKVFGQMADKLLENLSKNQA